MDSARALLTGVVDYAGLFPPAALPMADAVAEYVRARGSAEAWMLGRFVVPATRLAELADARAGLDAAASDTWRLSAIVRAGSTADWAAIEAANLAAAATGAVVDTVECRPDTLEGVDWLAETCAACDVFVEVATGDEAPVWLAHVAARGLKAKVRTGGVTAEAFPAPAALLRFIDVAVRLRVPFKATAGLHHAVRGAYALTYEPGASHAPMYGYLNVLLATAALRAGLSMAAAEDLLCRTDTASLVFTAASVRWGAVELPLPVLRDTRAQSLTSVGSCSFREPVAESRALLATPDVQIALPAS